MHRSSLHLALAALLALLAPACTSATAASPSVLEVGVAASRPVFVRGDTIHVTVVVRNPTSSPVEVSGSSSSLLAFRVLDADGRVLAGSDRVSTADLLRRTVPARGTLSHTLVWNGSQSSGVAPLALVPPGTYRVVGVLNAVEGEQVSEPVTVELRAP